LLLEAIKLQKRSGSLPELSNCYLSLSKLYEEVGNFKDALYFSTASFTLKDSITNETKTREFIALEKQFESFKGDKKYSYLKETRRFQNSELEDNRTTRSFRSFFLSY